MLYGLEFLVYGEPRDRRKEEGNPISKLFWFDEVEKWDEGWLDAERLDVKGDNGQVAFALVSVPAAQSFRKCGHDGLMG